MIRSVAVTAVLAMLAAIWAHPVSAATAASAASAATAPAPAVVPVGKGINRVVLGKQPVLALRAHRENYNVHSFDLVSFYFMGSGESKGEMNLIPLFGDAKSKEQELSEISVGGGADCTLHDFRLLQPQGAQPAQLVVAERDFGESYADAATVRFTYYRLVRNDDEVEGAPLLSFKLHKRAGSRQKYCDVNEAFDRELRMGRASGREAP